MGPSFEASFCLNLASGLSKQDEAVRTAQLPSGGERSDRSFDRRFALYVPPVVVRGATARFRFHGKGIPFAGLPSRYRLDRLYRLSVTRLKVGGPPLQLGSPKSGPVWISLFCVLAYLSPFPPHLGTRLLILILALAT